MRSRFQRKAGRVAAALLRRMRSVRERVFAPDEVDRQLARLEESVGRTDLTGRVAVVTGSSRGVGLAVARSLAQAKARVVINARSPEPLAAAAAELQAAGGEAIAVPADVSTPDGAQELIERAVQAYGRIDILVNNAAVGGPLHRKPWEIDAGEWASVLGTNLSGAFFCAHAAMRWMVEHGAAGRILNVSSGAGRAAAPGMAPYVASKFGLEGLTRALAQDADDTGITVAAIELGTLQTQMARPLVSWEDFQSLPPAETVVPIFLHAATAPRAQVHGRVFAAWRHGEDPEAEALLASPLALFPRAAFPSLRRGGKIVERGDPSIVCLDRAENPLGMPPRVRKLLASAAASLDLSRYPDEHYPGLRASLGKCLGLPEECFTFASGSVELVERIVRTFTGPGDEVVSNDPTWFMFDRFCGIADVVPRKVRARQQERDGTFDHDLEAMAAAIGPRTRLVYLVNPSNPLGNGIDADAFSEFLTRVPPELPLVVDEAYIEFSTRPQTLRTHEVVLQSDRSVIGLRTFSKFYALAGLRVGYAFAAPRVRQLLDRLEPLFAVSSLAERAAMAALEDEEHAVATRALIDGERERIASRLREVGLGCVPGEIHFMLVECPLLPERSGKVWEAFENAGIFVPKGLVRERYLLFPIWNREQNDRNLELLLSL